MNNKKRKLFFQEFTHFPPQKWMDLLVYMMNKANFVEFVVKGKDIPSSLHAFRSDLIKIFPSKLRWGARRWGTTYYARFALSGAMRGYLLQRPTLGSWLIDLEDPSLYMDDQVVMWTISHDNLAFVWLSDDEVQNFNTQGYSFEIVPPSEVRQVLR